MSYLKCKNSRHAHHHLFHADKDALVTQKLARLDAFTTLNPRPIIEVDFKGNILDANNSALNFFPDLRRKGIKHPYLANLNEVIKFLKIEKTPFGREIKIKERWFKQRFYLVPNFALIHIYGSDVTDRKQTELALQESELRYRSLFNKMSEGYALCELIVNKQGRPFDYRFLDLNPALENLTGLTRQQTIGKTIRQILPGTDSMWIQDYGYVISTGKSAHFERYHQELDRYYEVFAYKIHGMQFAVLYLDITDLKKVTKEKDNFISIMSHELRNPLTPILANAQFINSTIIKEPATLPNKEYLNKVKESLQIIERQSKNMAQLLDDMLDISKMSREKISLKLKITDVRTIVTHALQSTLPFATKRKQQVSLRVPKRPVYANIDPLRFEQIIINLINNAAKYTKPKGKISIKVIARNNKIRVQVKDNGIGMNPKKTSRIFELFNRSSKPVMGIGGMGIGLNLVKNLVTLHKGTIYVKSKGKNKGSEFTVAMPATKAVHLKKIGGLKPHSQQLPKKKLLKILIADDDEDIANTLSRILSQEGYLAKKVYNGITAIKLSKTFKPDVALIDIRMPGADGYQIARAIKNGHTTLIALTGYGQDKDKDLSKKAGFEYHLTKPIDINELIALLNSAKGTGS